MEKETKPATKRLYSLDALRGFEMFWIMGGEGIIIVLAALTGWLVFEWGARHLEHVEWHGFHFYDMIFPLFLFCRYIVPFLDGKTHCIGREPENNL